MRHTSLLTSMLAVALSGGCYDLDALRAITDGAADLQTIDGGGDFCSRPTPACGAQALFCDGFENGATFPGWDQDEVGNYAGGQPDPGSAVALSTSTVCRGQNSLSTTVVGATQYAQLARAVPLPNPVYIRFFYQRPSSSTKTQVESLQLFSGTGATQQISQLSLQPDHIGWQNFSGSSQIFIAAEEADRWRCIELMVDVDATAGAVKLWVDEALIGSYAGIDTHFSSGPPNHLSLGTTVGAGVQGALQIYYDEVVVSAAPIGC